jgi:hypothetical protein
VVREQIKTFASAAQIGAAEGHKLIILDEADQMTSAAQVGLRRSAVAVVLLLYFRSSVTILPSLPLLT